MPKNVKCIIVVHPALALTLIWYAGVDKTKLLKNVVFNYQLKRYKNRKVYTFVERKINFISLKNANMMPLEEMRLPLFPTAYLSRAQKGNTSIHFIHTSYMHTIENSQIISKACSAIYF